MAKKKKQKETSGSSGTASGEPEAKPVNGAVASADRSAPGVRPPEEEWPEEATPIVPPPDFPHDPAEPTPVSVDPPPGTPERRLHRRVPFFRKIEYKFETLDAFRTLFANDISIGGMFIKTDRPEPIGSVIFLEFDLKDGSVILAGYGKVVRVNPVGVPDFDAGMGVEFLKFDEDSMVKIKQLVKDRF